MKPWVTRMSAETAAGSGVEALLDAIVAGEPCARPAPWAWAGIAGVGAVRGGCLEGAVGDAEVLLQRVVDAVDPGEVCGLVVGTTSGAIAEFERSFPETGVHDWRQRPTRAVAARCATRWAQRGSGGGAMPVATVSVACASGAAAFDVARGWLRSGRCTRVIVAGVDVLSPFIHAGFAGIGALAAARSRPFTAARDGLMIGEGAAAVLLETPESAIAAGRSPICALWGTGLSQDAVHLTAPDRTGGGLYRAALAATEDARISLESVPDAIDMVSGHATGTLFNDAMEARALARLFGAAPVPVHAVKPIVGHTLGAAGMIEAVALMGMLAGGRAPRAIEVDPALGMVGGASRRSGGFALSVNAAFGGVNTALVFGPAGSPRGASGSMAGEPRQGAATAVVTTETSVEGEQFPVVDLPRLPDGSIAVNLGRADTYVRAGIVALAQIGARPGEAIVLSSVENCAQADRRYLDVLVRSGPERAPRVHFVYTIPGAPLAEAAILLGLTGPGLVFCDEGATAEAEARRLVEEGRVDSAIALIVDAGAPGVARATARRYSSR